MNTVGEDEGTRAELINTSSGSERTPAQADPGLLPASFSSWEKKKNPPLWHSVAVVVFFCVPYHCQSLAVDLVFPSCPAVKGIEHILILKLETRPNGRHSTEQNFNCN